MKVQNMTSSRGNEVPNQFIITDSDSAPQTATFQSYKSVIATIKTFDYDTKQVFLDSRYWDYSRTTSKYRNQFLGETKKETQAKIDSGEYILTDLN
jgi:hypothetical protein